MLLLDITRFALG